MRRPIWLVVPAIFAIGSVLSADEEPTYHGKIKQILAKNCVVCHQTNGPSPFPLATFEEVRRRAALIRWVCLVGTMPPIDAVGDFGAIAAVPKLTSDDLIALQEWVRVGAPEGKETPPPTIPKPAWRIERPDVSLRTVVAQEVASEGAPYRKLFLLDPALKAPRSLEAFAIVPDAPQAVRHAYLAVVPKDVDPAKVFAPTGIEASRLVGAWAPGYQAWHGRPGVEVEPGDRLAVSVLYQPTGKAERGSFALDLKWGEPQPGGPTWTTLGKRDFQIPPADEITTLAAEMTFDSPRKLLAIVPECRLFAQQVIVTAHFPDGSSKRILHILTWDRNWVGAYQPADPIRLPAGTTVEAQITYENAGHAEGNREARPTTAVKFGSDDTSELFWVHLQTVSDVP